MAASSTNLSALLEKLHISDEAMPVLQELKSTIQEIHPTNLQNHISPHSLVPVFDRLNSSNRAEIELCCDILTYMMELMSAITVLTELSQQLVKTLNHPNIDIITLALKQLLRGCVSEVEVECIVSNQTGGGDYMSSLIPLLAHENLSLVTHATNILTNIGRYRIGRIGLTSDRYQGLIADMMSRSDTIRYRVYEVVLSVCLVSHDTLSDMTPLLSSLIREVTGGNGAVNDVLTHLNAIEMLTRLVDTQHGLVYLDSCGVLGTLHTRLVKYYHGGTGEDDTTASLLLPGMMKLFGHASVHDPALVCSRYPGFLPVILGNVTSSRGGLATAAAATSPGHLMVSLQTVSLLASTAAGKVALAKYDHVMCKEVMVSLCSLVTSGQTDVRVVALNTLTSLVNNTSTYTHDSSQESSITKTWFASLYPSQSVNDGVEMVYGLCRQPFVEIRCAAIYLLNALLTQWWGVESVLGYPGIVEYILDRGSESSSAAGQRAKYQVVTTLVTGPHTDCVQRMCGAPIMVALRSYYREGAHYVQHITDIATEDMS